MVIGLLRSIFAFALSASHMMYSVVNSCRFYVLCLYYGLAGLYSLLFLAPLRLFAQLESIDVHCQIVGCRQITTQVVGTRLKVAPVGL